MDSATRALIVGLLIGAGGATAASVVAAPGDLVTVVSSSHIATGNEEQALDALAASLGGDKDFVQDVTISRVKNSWKVEASIYTVVTPAVEVSGVSIRGRINANGKVKLFGDKTP